MKVISEQARHRAKAVSSPVDILDCLIPQRYAKYTSASPQQTALLQGEAHAKEKQCWCLPSAAASGKQKL